VTSLIQTLKSKLAKLSSIIFIVLLQSNYSQAAPLPTEIELVSEAWVNSVQEDGTGLYLDILRLIYEPLGIKVNTTYTDYARSVALVKQGKKDAWLGSYMNEEENIIYPKWHLDADIVAALYKKSPSFQFQGEKSLAGKNVGWIKGYDYNDYMDTKFNNKEFKTREKALSLLLNGRLDFFLEDQRELDVEFKKGAFDKDQFEYKTLMNLKTYPAFVNNERGQQLQKIYDEGFVKLLESGEIKKLYDKWNEAFFPFSDK